MLLLSSVLAYIENITLFPLKEKESHSKHVVVFDLDKTIGDFDVVSGMYGICHSENVNVLELFPECFRPGIFHIFELLHIFKKDGSIDKVVIYTNNTGGKKCVNYIVTYIHKILGFVLFDDIVSGYYVNKNEVQDNRRTTMDKERFELMKILKLNETDHLMFVDDIHHSGMVGKNVMYIQVTPYELRYTRNDMLTIINENRKLSRTTKTILGFSISSYNTQVVQSIHVDCMYMIDFTKLIAKFVVEHKLGYAYLTNQLSN